MGLRFQLVEESIDFLCDITIKVRRSSSDLSATTTRSQPVWIKPAESTNCDDNAIYSLVCNNWVEICDCQLCAFFRNTTLFFLVAFSLPVSVLSFTFSFLWQLTSTL